MRYSPNGKHLLVQNSSGVYIVSRDPLHILGYLATPNSYDARFSGDSQSVIVVSFGLNYGRWNFIDAKKIDGKDLPIREGCLDAELSPDGDLLACYRPDLSLGLYQISTDQWIFSEQIRHPDPHLFFAPVPLDLDTAFAGAFGFVLSNDMKPLANRHIIRLSMAFSPDGKTIIAGDQHDALRVDLVARKKASVPGGLQKRIAGTLAFQGQDRVLVIDREKEDRPAILSFTNGEVISSPDFKADYARVASNSRYAFLYDAGMQGARAFDLEQNRELDVPENIGADIYGSELAVFNENGDIFLYRVGEKLPFAALSLPLDNLPILRSASLTPSLDKLAFAVDGEGGLFQVGDGRRVANFPRFSAVNFEDPFAAFLLMPRRRSTPQQVLQLDTKKGTTALAWSGGKSYIRSGGPVLLEYSFESPMGRGILMVQEGGVPFLLRALDPVSGKELWKQSFMEDPPIPFADPQGDRLVLGWKAKSSGAREAAKRSATTKEAFKRAKLGDHDSFFEVLDARSRKSVGGVLVQTGAGPASFDSAFSLGNMLFLQKDALRVSVYSIQDGQLKSRLIGTRLAASPQSNLFALFEESGRMSIYDLQTFSKLDQLLFPDDLAYIHFSADGRRLFALTEHQEAFVLDVSKVRETIVAAPPTAADNN